MILNKPLLITSVILLVALSLSGYYIKTLLEKNALLYNDNKEKTEQLVSLERELLY